MKELTQLRRDASVVGTESAPESARPVSFCSHCGKRPQHDADSRVCESCNLGLIIQADSQNAPSEGDPFLLIDDSLSVCGVSSSAEHLLATTEKDAVNRHITEVLVPADVELLGPANLAVAITWAARGSDVARRVYVRPANTFGLRMTARIASCGPPKAALLVFE
jgi:hypothetical protein